MKTIAKNIKLLSQVTDIFNEFDWPNLLFEGIWLAEPYFTAKEEITALKIFHNNIADWHFILFLLFLQQ